MPYASEVPAHGSTDQFATDEIILYGVKLNAVQNYARLDLTEHVNFRPAQETVERLNKKIPSASRVSRVVFTSTQFGIDNGFLNRSLKINRAAVYDAFREALLGLE